MMFWSLIVILAVGYLWYQGVASRHMRAPMMGLMDGHLQGCSRKPNAVSSACNEADVKHYVAPLAYTTSRSDAQDMITNHLLRKRGYSLKSKTDRYLHFEHESRVFKFVDDIELVFDSPATGKAEVRSASRVGTSDFGVNRKRVEELRGVLM